MIKVRHIDHVAIAVADTAEASGRLAALFGLATTPVEHVPGQKTDVVFLHPGDGGTALEVVCPAGNQGLQRFLDRRGPGLHHVCFEVEDLAGALATLKNAGVDLIDEVPRPGARGHLVAFLHPRATGGVLFELCQTPRLPEETRGAQASLLAEARTREGPGTLPGLPEQSKGESA
jgi:methylmalonyl-CoA/ethylmalonyl-CoA epimerase